MLYYVKSCLDVFGMYGQKFAIYVISYVVVLCQCFNGHLCRVYLSEDLEGSAHRVHLVQDVYVADFTDVFPVLIITMEFQHPAYIEVTCVNVMIRKYIFQSIRCIPLD